MNKIYTKTGDSGTTSLRGGERVGKDDLRIEVNGLIDILNSQLGVVRASLKEEKEYLLTLQKELMIIMSHIATPDRAENPKELHCKPLTASMEEKIDALPHPDGFVIPGENALSSQIHLARSFARRVEVNLWKLNRTHRVKEEILVFFNRLSDYLFALAVNNSQ